MTSTGWGDPTPQRQREKVGEKEKKMSGGSSWILDCFIKAVTNRKENENFKRY